MDGWTKDPNLNSLKPFPWNVVCIYISFNFLTHLAITLSGAPTYFDVGVQTEVLPLITQHLINVSEAVSVMSVSYSPVDTIPTLLSGVPSIPGTESLYPELARTTAIANALRAQKIYNELLQQMDSNDPNFRVYKVFVSHAKRIFFQALCDGLEPGTIEFTQYLDDTLLSNRPLVNYLAQSGVNILDLIN